MVDLPDYYTQTAIAEAEAAGIKGGLDVNKADDPVSRDIYLATDTHILYVCFADGTWTGFDAAMLTQGTITLYENLVAGGKKITGLADPAAAQDAATQAYVLARCGLYLPLAGGTMTGDIQLGANALKTTDLLLRQEDANTLFLRNLADTLYKDIWIQNFIAWGSFYFGTSGYGVNAPNVDAAYATLSARDSGNTLVEIARLVGAADPYLQATLPMRFLPASEPGAVLEGMAWYDSGDDVMKYRDAAATRTIVPTREVWIPPSVHYVGATGGATQLTPGLTINANNEEVFFSWAAPSDFTSLVSLDLIVNANTTATHTLHHHSSYGAIGAASGEHTGTELNQDHALTLNVLTALDMSGLFPDLAAGDICGLRIKGVDPTTPNLLVIGLRLKYNAG